MLFGTYRLLSHFYVFGSTWYLSFYLAEYLNHPRSISLMPLPSGKITPGSHRETFLKILDFLWWVRQYPPELWDRFYVSWFETIICFWRHFSASKHTLWFNSIIFIFMKECLKTKRKHSIWVFGTKY